MRAEPHASCQICRMVTLQSVALFYVIWEQKLINNFYCLRQHTLCHSDIIVCKVEEEEEMIYLVLQHQLDYAQ